MAQQISDLVINLNADTATFSEQMRKARGQLSEMATNADISAERVRRLEERLAASMKGFADSNSQAMENLESQQSRVADSLNKQLNNSAQAVAAVKENVGQYSQQLQQNQSSVAATEDAQDKLTESYYRQIDSIKQLSTGMKQLDALRESIRSARDAGKLDQNNYLALVTAASDKGITLVEDDRAATAAKEAFLQKLREQSALYKASAIDAAEYRAQQLGITQEAAPLISAMRDQEAALRREADQKRAAEIASRGLKAALKEQEAAERAVAAENQRAESTRKSFIDSLQNQVNAIGKTRTELLELKAVELGVSTQTAPLIARLREQDEAWRKGTISVGQYRQAIRMLPAQFTDIVTSIASGMPLWLVMFQQGGQISDSFGGLGGLFKYIKEELLGMKGASDESSESLSENANSLADNAQNARGLASVLTPARLGMIGLAGAGALLAYHFYKAADRAEQLRQSLAMTNSYSGLTSTAMANTLASAHASGLTYAEASESLRSLIDAGMSAGANFDKLTVTIANFSDKSGVALDELAKNFVAIANDPSKGILALNEKYHFLTAVQYQHIAALQEEGKYTDALAAANQAAADGMDRAATNMKNSLGTISSIMEGIKDIAKGMWDAIEGIGRGPTQGEALKSLISRRDSIQAQVENSERTGYNQKNGKLDKWRGELNELNTQVAALTLLSDVQNATDKAASDAQAQHNQNLKDAIDLQQGLNQGLKNSEKREKAINELNRQRIRMNQAAAVDPKNNLGMSDADYQKRLANINNQFKDPKTPKGTKYQPPAGDKAEDSAQADLLALQSQLVVLREHTGLNDKISQQRKDLWKAQAEFTVLEQAAGTRQLSTQEKSLLASKETVLASKERLAVLGDEVAQQERLNKLQDASTKYVTQMAEKQQAMIDSAGMSDRMAQRESTFAQLRQGWQNQGGSLEDEGYKKQLEAAKNFYAEEDKLRGQWQNSASSALENYIDQASDVAGMTKSLFTNAFNGLENALVSFVTTGKAKFRDFATSIISDMARIAMRMAISNGLQSIFGAIGGSIGGTTASASSAGGTGAMGMGTGWQSYTANAKGGVYSSPGLSAYSGQVVNRPTFFAFAKGAGVMGEAGPEAILPLKRGADGSLGVRAIGAQGGEGYSSSAPQVYITIESNGQTATNAPSGFEQFGSEVGKLVSREYVKLRDKDLRQGGVLNRAINGRG